MARKHALATLLRVLPWRQQGLPLWRCANRLNDEGATTFTGLPWSASRLHQAIHTGRVEAEEKFIENRDPQMLEAAFHLKGQEAQNA